MVQVDDCTISITFFAYNAVILSWIHQMNSKRSINLIQCTKDIPTVKVAIIVYTNQNANHVENLLLKMPLMH